MRESVQLYSVRDAFADDAVSTLQRLREMGFELVEPYGLVENREALRTALGESGLRAPSSHASVVSAADPAEVFAAASELGVETVIDPAVDPSRWRTEDDIRSIAESLNSLAQVAGKHGVRLGYHNHAFECETDFSGRTGLEVLAEHLDPAVLLEIDTYWVAVAGVDVPGLLGRLGERVQLLHLKDGPLTEDDKEQLPLGEGKMDIPALLAAAPWIDLGVIEFDDYAGDVLEGVRVSREYLSRIRGAAS